MAQPASVVRDEENAILRSIARGEETPAVLEAIVAFLEAHLATARVAILLFDASEGRLVLAAAGALPEAFLGQVVSLPPSRAGTEGGASPADPEELHVSLVGDDRRWSREQRAAARAAGIAAGWHLPIWNPDGGLLGMVCAYSAEAREPSPRELDLLQVATHLAELVLERNEWRRSLRERADHLEQLVEFRRGVMELVEESLRADRPGEFFQRALDRLVAVLPQAQTGSVLVRADDGHYDFVAAHGYDLSALQRVRFSDDAVWFDPADPQPTVIQMPQVDQSLSSEEQGVLVAEGRALDIRSVLVVPVVEQGVVNAYLTLDNLEDVHAFGDEDLEFARVFAGQVGVLLRRFKLEQELHRMAYTDHLTGLHNRAGLLDRLPRALEAAGTAKRSVALVFVDLDDVKPVNDSLGHLAGDEVLRVVATRLSRCAEGGALLARIGGDEFVVVIERENADADAMRFADRFLTALGEPIRTRERNVFVGASLGISSYPALAQSTEDLLRQADIAMYHAKQRGKNRYVTFLPEMESAPRERLALEEALRAAIEGDELVLHYQPRVDAATGRIVCVEALVRWEHPERGLLYPASFIPFAETTNLIGPLGRKLLLMAARQAREWRESGFSETRVSVNLSARQLDDPGLVDEVRDALETAGLPADALELEVLESEAVKDVHASGERLTALKGLGVSVALDDFGMGYSNLAFLNELPVDTIKVDRALTAGLRDGAPRNTGAIVGAIVALARGFGMRVVAEGVEEWSQLDRLRALGCDEAQGFLLARPMPPEDVAALFERRTLVG